jgi:hypothetical protein
MALFVEAAFGAAPGKPAAQRDIGAVINALRPPAGYRPAPPQDLQAEASEWAVEISWKKSRDMFVKHYAVYVEQEIEQENPEEETEVRLEKLAEIDGTSFREEGLEPDSNYIYWVTSVATNGKESEPTIIETTTLTMTRPPLEVDILEMKDIFTNNYKIYETEGIGRINIRNNTDEQITRLKVSLSARGIMDFPSELELRDIEPHSSRTVPLKAVINNKALDILEDTPLQTEITLSYYFNGQLQSFTTSRTTMLHDKHRMLWKDPDMAAVFVTPKDPPVLDLSRAVVTQVGDSRSPLVLAGALYETLGLIGITYVRDPSNPYQISDGRVDTVDYVQFPVETLQRKSGDCKGMVMLFSSLLESLGIRTIMLDYPGHMLLMFSVAKGDAVTKGELSGLLFPYDGELWAPVELTLIGSSFISAWEKGSSQFQAWTARKGLGMTDIRSAWKRYKPATLPAQLWHPPSVSRQELEKKFSNELTLLKRLAIQAASPALFEAVHAHADDVQALLQLGIRFGEEGDTAEAFRYLKRAAEISPKSAEVINNLANLYLLEGDHQMALKLYNQAVELDPADPFLLINLARCYLKMGRIDAANSAYSRGVRLFPEIQEQYRGLAVELAY